MNSVDRLIGTIYRQFCYDHCECDVEDDVSGSIGTDEGHSIPTSNEGYTDGSEAGSGDFENSAQDTTPNVQHTCSGSCTQVDRGCSWAYTGECMCTADKKIGFPFYNMFISHGCAAVVGHVSSKLKSKLGGRDVGLPGLNASVESNLSSSDVANWTSTNEHHPNSIVKALDGYFNASTGIQIACPCNTTCVSYGCCGSNGMTFAPEDKCLGELDIAGD